MEWRLGRRVSGAALYICRRGVLSVAACAFALAACQPQSQPELSAAQPRGASIAFESIDGLPHSQFQTLVQDLNQEALTRRLAVISRAKPSAYRVRGYLAADIIKGKTKIYWVWDVFDRNKHRVLRISGSQVAHDSGQEGWPAVSRAMLHEIADRSMDKLAAFLTSPAVAPGTAPAQPQLSLAAMPPAASPEAAGIFRIFPPHADPVAEAATPPPAQMFAKAARTPVPAPGAAGAPVAAPSTSAPLPRERLPSVATVPLGTTTTLSARAIY